MAILTTFYENLYSIFQWVDLIKTTIGISSLYGIYSFLKNHIIKKKIRLSIGEFTIKKKDYTVQNVTNIVSNLFYDGGVIPDNIRKEILRTMCPKVTNLKIKTE